MLIIKSSFLNLLVSDDNISHSPKGHFRSQSDGTVMAQSEDLLDLKREQTDKKSVKAILTQLLQSVHGITHIQVLTSVV